MKPKRWILTIKYITGEHKGETETRNSNVKYTEGKDCINAVNGDLYRVLSCKQHPDWVRPSELEKDDIDR